MNILTFYKYEYKYSNTYEYNNTNIKLINLFV